MNDTTRPSKAWAYVAVVVGLLLFLAGAASALGYLGLPVLFPGENVLGSQLGEMAAIFLGLVCGALGLVSVLVIPDPRYLLGSMVGVGIAGIASNTAAGWLLERGGTDALYFICGIGSLALGALTGWILPRARPRADELSEIALSNETLP